MSLLEKIIIEYRWVFVCFFLLPASFVYDIWFYLRNKIVFKLRTAPKLHDLRVKDIQQQVRKWNESGQKVPMCTGRPGYQTVSFREGIYKSNLNRININLVDVLEVNTDKRTVRVEPLVSMGQVTATLNSIGWTLPIIPELDDLTIGGLIMGSGIESSSHKYGLFQHICVSYELVMSDGSLVRCSKEENSDLFYSVPWSHGTVGFLVAAEIKIIPAKKYIKMNYIPCYTSEQIQSVIAQNIGKFEFIEGIAYSETTAVVMTADLTDEVDYSKLNKICSFNKPWFFEHARSVLDVGPKVEFIPIRDYYHRHSRGLFWEMMYIIPFGNHWLFRNLFGWLTPPKISLMKLTQGQTVKELYEKHHVIQDMFVPLKHLSEAISFFDKTVKVYPLWLCPMTLPNEPGFVQTGTSQPEVYIDIGVYGEPLVKNFQPKETTRECEAYVRNVNGFQMLYADSYLTKEEFREMFDHTLYDQVREKYQCKKAFPDVYDKVSKSARR